MNTNIFAKLNFQYSYSNIQYSETKIRIFEYIRIFALYKRQFLTEYEYEYIRRIKFTIFVFEYQIFGDKYSNIRIYSNIRPTLGSKQAKKLFLGNARVKIFSAAN